MCLPKGISNGKRSRRPEKEPQLVDDSILLRDFRFRIIRNESKCSQKKKKNEGEKTNLACGGVFREVWENQFVWPFRFGVAVGSGLWAVGCPES